MSYKKVIMDGNEAAAYVSYAFTEVAGIFPITPSSPMAEHVDEWAAPVKKALPVLSFPSIQLMNCTVRDLISDSDMQARGMKLVADRVDAGASVSLTDLSVEAECFGAPIHVSNDEVPTCVGPVISTEVDEDERLAQAEALRVPEVGEGRTDLYIEAIEKALKLIEDRPVLAGVIGPFSLAGRLVSVTEAMLYCYDEPDMMHTVLEKTTEFITKYILAYKAIGAHGVVIAEPLAGLLSPSLAQEFSGDYCKRIMDAVKDEGFAVVYHNCGNTANVTLDSIFSCGANAYHFGNAVKMRSWRRLLPTSSAWATSVPPRSSAAAPPSPSGPPRWTLWRSAASIPTLSFPPAATFPHCPAGTTLTLSSQPSRNSIKSKLSIYPYHSLTTGKRTAYRGALPCCQLRR